MNIPSISYTVIVDGKRIYSNAVGYLDIENKIPATDTTMYSIASLTKPIAASLIMRLVEEGRMDLDKKIRDYWPVYDAYFRQTRDTIREKMPWLLPYIEHYNFDRYDITVRQHLSHTAEFVPGTRYKYNGYLFGRLVAVIDNVVPQKFVGLMDSLILKKLGMEHAFLDYLHIRNDARISNLAIPYLHVDERLDSLKRVAAPDQRLNAGAGLLLSVRDLGLFDSAFDRSTLVGTVAKK